MFLLLVLCFFLFFNFYHLGFFFVGCCFVFTIVNVYLFVFHIILQHLELQALSQKWLYECFMNFNIIIFITIIS